MRTLATFLLISIAADFGLSSEAQEAPTSIGSESHDVSVLLAETAKKQSLRSQAVSADGNLVAAGTDRGIVKIYYGRTGDLISAFKVSNAEVLELKLSPSGDRLFVKSAPQSSGGSKYEMLRIPAVDRSHEVIWRDDTSIRNLVFSPRGTYFSARIKDGLVGVWESETGQQLMLLNPGRSPVTGTVIKFSPDEKTLATSYSHGFSLWDIERQALIASKSHKHMVTSIDFSPNSELVASSSWDATVTLWNTKNGKKKRTTKHPYRVQHVDFSDDGEKLLTSMSSSSRIYDVSSGKLLLSMPTYSGEPGAWDDDFASHFVLEDEFLIGRNGKVWDAKTGYMFEPNFSGTHAPKFAEGGSKFVAMQKPGHGRSIIIGDLIVGYGLDRELSESELAILEQQAAARTKTAKGELRAAQARRIQQRKDIAKKFRAYERERARLSGQPTILESFLQGASLELQNYNAQEQQKRAVARQEQELNNRLKASGEATSPAGSSTAFEGESSVITIGVSYDDPVQQLAAVPAATSTIPVQTQMPQELDRLPPCDAPKGASCVTPE